MFKKTLVTVMAVALAVILSVSAFADFTPSVAVKPAPNVEEAAIFDDDGNKVADVVAGEIVVTPYADKNAAPNADIKTKLEDAYSDLDTKPLNTLAPAVMDEAKKFSASIKVDDLVVRDLFDVALTGAAAGALTGGKTVKIRFATGIPAGDLLIVLHDTGDATWKVETRVERNSDGSVTVEFDTLSAIAFVTTTASPVTPPTGDMPLWATILMASVGVCGVAVVVIAVVSKKRAVA